MKTNEALKIIGGSLSKPSKMPGWSIGLPAKECKTGGKLQAVKGSVCYDCYALKGCYVFKVVQDAQYRRLRAIKDPQWTTAMAHLINSKKPDVFRWSRSWTSPESCHLKTSGFLLLIKCAIAVTQAGSLIAASLLYCASCTTLNT